MVSLPARLLQICRFGSQLQRYGKFREVQKSLHELRRRNEIPDTLLTLQVSPVYTVGKRRAKDQFLTHPEELRSCGFDVEFIDRGGEVTYHGPGQIVLYPIISLRKLKLGARLFVEKLENVMIDTSAEYGVEAEGRIPKKRGVWVKNKKIGAIGVRISQGISSHGIAFNVKTDLTHYQHITPCGFNNKDVTNLHQESPLKEIEDILKVESTLIQAFMKEFRFTERLNTFLKDILKTQEHKNDNGKESSLNSLM